MASGCQDSRDLQQAASFHDVEGLAEDLCSVVFDEGTADVVLVVGEAQLPAHRAILAARSPVFRAMFFGSMSEVTAREVPIQAFAAPTMRLLLQFLYSGRLQDVGLEEMVPLMACADHFNVTSLRDSISAHLCDAVLPETAVAIVALARQFHQDQLVEQCMASITEHANIVLQDNESLSLDSGVWLMILESDETRMEEIDLFKSLVRWWEAVQETERYEAQYRQLFEAVRYGLMTGPQLVTAVRPLVGDIVSSDSYMRALELAAARDCFDSSPSKRCRQRLPPNIRIRVSDAQLLTVQGKVLQKLGPQGWNCTAVVEPSTSRTRFAVQHLTDPAIGVGVAVLRPFGGDSGTAEFKFIRADHMWNDGVLGIMPNGGFYGVDTRKMMLWHRGAVFEVTTRLQQPGTVHVVFSSADNHPDGNNFSVEGIVASEQPLTLVVALHSPLDAVSIQSLR